MFNKAERRLSDRRQPDFAAIHQELSTPAVTLQLLWEAYRAINPDDAYSYSQFTDLYRSYVKTLRLSMRQPHPPGEAAFVDFSGKRPSYIDPQTQEWIYQELFVGALGNSQLVFAVAIPTQGTPACRPEGGRPPDPRNGGDLLPQQPHREPRPRSGGRQHDRGRPPAPNHRAYAERTPELMRDWATSIGPSVLRFVEHQFDRAVPALGLPACDSLRKLAGTYGEQELEAACARAVAIKSPTVKSVRSLLSTGRCKAAQQAASGTDAVQMPPHTNVRGPDYYAQGGQEC